MLQFWKIKGEIKAQSHETSMLKEEVQSLYDQHKKNIKDKEKPDKTIPDQVVLMLTNTYWLFDILRYYYLFWYYITVNTLCSKLITPLSGQWLKSFDILINDDE